MMPGLQCDPAERSPAEAESRAPRGGVTVSRVGLDLGDLETRIALPPEDGAPGPRFLSVPSALSYSLPEAEPIRFCCVGARALERRDHLRLVHPLRVGVGGDEAHVLRDYALKLRGLFQKRSAPAPWGVIGLTEASAEEEKDAKRAVAGAMFERFVFVDDMFLIAVAMTSQAIRQHSIIIDIGQTSIRGALMHGVAPLSAERTEVAFGSEQMNRAYREAFALRYPELMLTDPTLEKIRGRFAFLAPRRRQCLLEIKCRGTVKAVDVSEIVEDASVVILRPILRAARDVLAMCPSDEIESFQKNILLVGGGARMLGVAQRVETELRADGFDQVRVTVPESPELVIARGAYLWAQSLGEDDWSIPLFSFGD